jgi:SMODS and SLOG-associating 2TM effector domain 1
MAGVAPIPPNQTDHRASEDATLTTTPDPLKLIHDTLTEHDDAAKDLQKRRYRAGTWVALLGPIVIVLQAVQTSFFREPGKLVGAYVLLIFEALFLLVALVWVLLRIDSAHAQWMRERICSEILRREEFLCLARVGPYLRINNSLLARVQDRLLLITSPHHHPTKFLPLRDDKEYWRDSLEDAHTSGELPEVPDLANCMEAYLIGRVDDQRQWFSRRGEKHLRHAQNFEGVTMILLFLAALAAIIHFFYLRLVGNTQPPSGVEKTLILVTFCLPAIAAAVVGLESLTESKRLNASYAYHTQILEYAQTHLNDLKAGLGSATVNQRKKLQFEFMRTVLAVEEDLSREVHLWWLVMSSSAPRPEV